MNMTVSFSATQIFYTCVNHAENLEQIYPFQPGRIQEMTTSHLWYLSSFESLGNFHHLLCFQAVFLLKKKKKSNAGVKGKGKYNFDRVVHVQDPRLGFRPSVVDDG